jgi:hypothetical protein
VKSNIAFTQLRIVNSCHEKDNDLMEQKLKAAEAKLIQY